MDAAAWATMASPRIRWLFPMSRRQCARPRSAMRNPRSTAAEHACICSRPRADATAARRAVSTTQVLSHRCQRRASTLAAVCNTAMERLAAVEEAAEAAAEAAVVEVEVAEAAVAEAAAVEAEVAEMAAEAAAPRRWWSCWLRRVPHT